jgi:hypothetical protein
MTKITPAAQAAFGLAAAGAKDLGSRDIDIEHLFLGLCKVDSLRKIKASQTFELPLAELRSLETQPAAGGWYSKSPPQSTKRTELEI